MNQSQNRKKGARHQPAPLILKIFDNVFVWLCMLCIIHSFFLSICVVSYNRIMLNDSHSLFLITLLLFMSRKYFHHILFDFFYVSTTNVKPIDRKGTKKYGYSRVEFRGHNT
jgi:hypothetical protein